MDGITVGKNDTIEEVVQRRVTGLIESGENQHLLGNFTQSSQVSSKVLGVSYKEGDVYDIYLEFEHKGSEDELEGVIKGIPIQLNYRIVRDPTDDAKLVGVYTTPKSNVKPQKEISKQRFSALVGSAFKGDSMPDDVAVRLIEIGFTGKRGMHEVLYREKEPKDYTGYSKLRLAWENVVKEDGSLVLHALWSREPSLIRFRKSNVSPWIIIGTPVGLATSIAAAAATAGVVYGGYGLVKLLQSYIK